LGKNGHVGKSQDAQKDAWLKLSMASKNRLNSTKPNLASDYACYNSPTAYRNTKTGTARAICPQMHSRRGYGFYVRAATKTKRPNHKTT